MNHPTPNETGPLPDLEAQMNQARAERGPDDWMEDLPWPARWLVYLFIFLGGAAAAHLAIEAFNQ